MINAVVWSQMEPESIVTFGGGLFFAQFIQYIHADLTHPSQDPRVVNIHGSLDVLSCADKHVLTSTTFIDIVESEEILVFVQEVA